MAEMRQMVGLGLAGVMLLLAACIPAAVEQGATTAGVVTPETRRNLEKPLVVVISSPQADVTYTTDKKVTFDGSKSYDPDLVSLAPPMRRFEMGFRWRSSLDGPLENQATFSRYLSPGQHIITLEVGDIRGVVVSDTVSIIVTRTNTPPVARITSPPDRREEGSTISGSHAGRFGAGETIFFDGSRSSDPDGDPLWFRWEAGRMGEIADTPSFSRSFTYEEYKGGAGTITLTVMDPKGLTDKASVSLSIEERRTYGVEWYNRRFASLTLAPGETHEVELTFKNLGNKVWKKDGPNPVYLSYHWYGTSIQVARDQEGLRTPLPKDVAPGETITVKGRVKALETRGEYELHWDLVAEGITWFSFSGPEHMGGPWGGAYPMRAFVGQSFGYGP